MSSPEPDLLPDELPGKIQVGDWVRLRKPHEINLASRTTIRIRFPDGKSKREFFLSPWQVGYVWDDGDISPTQRQIDGYASPSALVKIAPPVVAPEPAQPLRDEHIARLEAKNKDLMQALKTEQNHVIVVKKLLQDHHLAVGYLIKTLPTYE